MNEISGLTGEIGFILILKIAGAVCLGTISALGVLGSLLFGVLKFVRPSGSNGSSSVELRAMEKQVDKMATNIDKIKTESIKQQSSVETNTRHISDIKTDLNNIKGDFHDQTSFLNRMTQMLDNMKASADSYGVTLGTVKTGIETLLGRVK